MSSNKGGMRLTDTCADCGSLEPGWAVVNRGVLVCDECCSVHRSLGRHFSQIKSIKKSYWPPSQLQMVQSLNNGGVNSLWEHTLAETKGRKKPLPKDPVHPTKAEFIRCKYEEGQFVCQSEESEAELSEQLISSVRTANLETSLRLIAQGANTNYLHPEKGSRALHVAARAGQLGQVELLLANGADPTLRDSNGTTPALAARDGGERETERRLTEVLYEVTDRLCYFVCKARADHQSGQHFILPAISDCIVQPQPPNNAATSTLRQLSNSQFEELAMDVYDEVDRRETENIWQLSGASLEHNSVVFLPSNVELSRTRNQARQKLAVCPPPQFSALVFDILYEAKRRHTLYERVVASEDEPLYDSVASDEDYATAEQLAILVAQNASGLPLNVCEVGGGGKWRQGGSVAQPPAPPPPPSQTERELREKLAHSESRLSQLTLHIHKLNSKVEEVSCENKELKRWLEGMEGEPCLDRGHQILHGGGGGVITRGTRPASMYETRLDYGGGLAGGGAPPGAEQLARRTSQLTKRISELWSALRSHQHTFVPAAERIRVAVAELAAIFPQSNEERVRGALRQLKTSTMRLEAECTELEKLSDSVRQSAFAIAQANRQLVTTFQ